MSNPTIQATVPSAALNRILHAASRAQSRSAPIYEMVQLAVRKGTLYAKCFNGAMGISAQTAVEDQGTGFEALVNAQTLAGLGRRNERPSPTDPRSQQELEDRMRNCQGKAHGHRRCPARRSTTPTQRLSAR